MVNVGIDFGTTYTCAAFYSNGITTVTINEQGFRTTPSCISFHEDEILIGEAAQFAARTNPENTIFDIKRMIGKKYSDREFQNDLQNWPFKVVDINDTPHVEVQFRGETKHYSALELTSMIFGFTKKLIENQSGEQVKDGVVITVPVYFNDIQRQIIRDAAENAGYSVFRIFQETFASAVAYELQNDGEKIVLIFDFGGGTLDVSLYSIDDGIFEILSSSGDNHLGGVDLDLRVTNYLKGTFKDKTGLDISQDKKAFARLRAAAENAKRTLSTTAVTTIEVDSLHEGVDFSAFFSRARFEDINKDLFEKAISHIKIVLDKAKINKKDVQHIVLVGGSSRIPRIQHLISDFFDGKDLNRSINPDEVVAYGAAVQCAYYHTPARSYLLG